MSTSDNNSHKEEKTDRSAMKKQSEKENEEEERESGNSGPDQLDDLLGNLSIQESTVPSDRKDIRVQFLINVPMGVTPEMSTNPQSYCQKFLDLLKSTAFREEDEFRLEDIAVVFCLNGKKADGDAVITELKKDIKLRNYEIAFKIFGYIWLENNGIPYRKIREQLKQCESTKELVRQFRHKDPTGTIYFCFFDADTVDFNHVLSSYIDVIKEHNYPTVMSTGYVFPENSGLRIKSEHDRQVRIITAEHFPLGTYYPEPNFCVLLSDESDTLRESFDYARDTENNMESPILIRQVKQREGFKAVFANKDPIITPVPKKKQYHTKPRTWAISAYTHGELGITEKYQMEKFGNKYKEDKRSANRGHIPLLMGLLNSDEMAHEIEKAGPFEGPGAVQVFKAAKAVREYRNIEPEA
ncbi:hypothetical protein PO909_029254 [Leuciscus waleckii]